MAGRAAIVNGKKRCTVCRKLKKVEEFRLLSSGYRQGMCAEPCEREWNADYWRERRSPQSKEASLASRNR